MNKPSKITFTGVDNWTDLDTLYNIEMHYPRVEWGFLVSYTNKGNRYQNLKILPHLHNFIADRSLHLCGQAAKQVAVTSKIDFKFINQFVRVQINGLHPPDYQIKHLQKTYGVDIILQNRQDEFDPDCSNQQLFDRSGGRGIYTTELPELLPNKIVGYAGGITPDNVLDFISNIKGTGEYWIDMESGVRTNDLFDLDKVLKVCEVVYGKRM